ncbi:MAG: glycosyltransferase family 4 protein [Sulfolobaceae archaeon]|nr:glycosyltransferase family 4 protein [Sulfolobaceae archaeon]
MKIIAVANIFNISGVSVHISNVLKNLVRLGNDVEVLVPSFLVSNKLDVLKDLERNGVKVNPFTYELIDRGYTAIRSRYSYFLFSHLAVRNLNDLPEVENKNIQSVLSDMEPDIVYDMHEDAITLKVSYNLAKRAKVPLVKLLHDEPFRYSYGRGYRRIMGIKGFAYDTLMYFFYRIDRKAYIQAMKEGVLKGILAVSKAPVYLSKIDILASKYGVPVKVLYPGNAYNQELISKFRNLNNKEDYAVFFARLVPQKGIRELPKIARRLEKYKVIVFGKFQDESEEKRFMKSITSNVEYRGYRPVEELYQTVAKAKVVIYPSHQDGFSLVVLDSVALGTSVVAYDIPAIRFVYGNIGPVKIVKEYDIEALSSKVKEVLDQDLEKYRSEHETENVKRFLELHKSWESVAKQTLEFLRGLVN